MASHAWGTCQTIHYDSPLAAAGPDPEPGEASEAGCIFGAISPLT